MHKIERKKIMSECRYFYFENICDNILFERFENYSQKKKKLSSLFHENSTKIYKETQNHSYSKFIESKAASACKNFL